MPHFDEIRFVELLPANLDGQHVIRGNWINSDLAGDTVLRTQK
jgi:hypothetical protein